MNVHTRAVRDLEPQKRPGMGRDWGTSSINQVSPKYMGDGPDDVFWAYGAYGGYQGTDSLVAKTKREGVDPDTMKGLGFYPKSYKGGKRGSVYCWVTRAEDHVLTNRGMKELAAHVAVGAHTAPKPGAPNESVVEALVAQVLQGGSPQVVLTRALQEDEASPKDGDLILQAKKNDVEVFVHKGSGRGEFVGTAMTTFSTRVFITNVHYSGSRADADPKKHTFPDAQVITIPRARKPGGPEAIRSYLHKHLPSIQPHGDLWMVYSGGGLGKMPDRG